MSSLFLRITLLVVLALTTAQVCLAKLDASATRANDCMARCREIGSPADPAAVKKKHTAAMLSCNKWNSSGSAVTRICIAQFLKFAQPACEIGCNERAQLNIFLSRPSSASLRKDCNTYKSQRPFPVLHNACLAGFTTGVEYFLKVGNDARDSMEECLSPEELEKETVVESTKPIVKKEVHNKNNTAPNASEPVKQVRVKTDAKDEVDEPQTPKLRAHAPAAEVQDEKVSISEEPAAEISSLLDQASL